MNCSPLGSFQPLFIERQGLSSLRRFAMSPSIYLDETRRVPGQRIEKIESDRAEGQWASLGPERYAHESEHLNPHVIVPPLTTPTRTEPADQPHFFKTLDHDWDLWEKHRDLVFETQKITGGPVGNSTWDKVYALAEDIWRYRFTIQHPGGNPTHAWTPMSHPTPALIYGSWCAGCAPLLTALCATMFVPARVVQFLDHAMTEVFIAGQWCLADNSTNMVEGDNEMMSRASLAEILIQPGDPARKFTARQRHKFWLRTAMMYSPNSGLWGEEFAITDLTPQTALGLYPNWKNPCFKSAHAHRYSLMGVPGRFQHPRLVLRQGQAFARRFWLGSLGNTQHITATFVGPVGEPERDPATAATWNLPPDGGAWFASINDHRVPLRQIQTQLFSHDATFGVWPNPRATWRIAWDLPMSALRENAWNTIAIGSTGSGPQFLEFSGYSDFIAPESAAFCARV